MNAGNKKHTQHAPSTKTECDYLYGWILKKKQKQTVTDAKISSKMVILRDVAGKAEEEEQQIKDIFWKKLQSMYFPL